MKEFSDAVCPELTSEQKKVINSPRMTTARERLDAAYARLEAAYARLAMLTATHEAAQYMHFRQTQLTQCWKVQSIVLVVFTFFCFLLEQVRGIQPTPVVGVLTGPHYKNRQSTVPSGNYIAASYIKWLAVSGARAIPIPYDASDALVDDIFPQINGLFLPGGGALLPPSAQRLWELANESNARGRFFPVWGTCLGFEFLLMLAANDTSVLGTINVENMTLPLELTNRPSQLYTNEWQTIVPNENLTMNNHRFGIAPDDFAANPQLVSVFNVTSISKSPRGEPFVSTIEPRDPDRYPYYGVQYHPEKNPFELGTCQGTNIPYEATNHSPLAIRLALHLAQFFGSLLLRNQAQGHHLYTKCDEYPLVNTYPVKTGIEFQETYLIPLATHWDPTEEETPAQLRRPVGVTQ